jgi:hypothetical protein
MINQIPASEDTLARRVEEAAGADRALDAEIHEAVTTFPARIGGPGWHDGALVVPAFPGWIPLPAYTASLDAAMSLVPDKWGTTLDIKASDRNRCEARLWFDGEGVRPVRGVAATPALALCAAALRARAHARTDLQS